MKAKKAERFVGEMATIACKASDIKSYVIIYERHDGTISHSRDGSFSAQLGLIRVAEKLMLNGIGVEEDGE